MRIKIYREIEISEREMFNYARCRDHCGVETIGREAINLTRELMNPVSVANRFPLERRDGKLYVNGFELVGNSIEKHLEGCEECFIMAATIGFEIDKNIYSLSIVKPSVALLADTAASSAVEDLCNATCESIEKDFGVKLTSRFSPGYGDLPLESQPDFLRAVNAGKEIGLTLTRSLLLNPIKSVTAIMGVIPEEKENA